MENMLINKQDKLNILYSRAVEQFNKRNIGESANSMEEMAMVNNQIEKNYDYLLLKGLVSEAFGHSSIAVDYLIKAHFVDLRKIEAVNHLSRIFLKIGDYHNAALYMGKSTALKNNIGKEDVFVFGDSHADFLFYGIPRCKSRSLGPRTMHRIGRDGLKILNFKELDVPDNSYIVLVFGEIDVRTHIIRQRDEKRREISEINELLCRNYLKTAIINKMMYNNVNVIICSIVPPTISTEDPDLPFYGTMTERSLATNLINSKLDELCKENGILFLDIHKYFRDNRGCLIRSLSDGIVHVRKEFCGIVEYELENIISASPSISFFLPPVDTRVKTQSDG